MRRPLWNMLFALIIGAGIGLVYAWNLAPRRITQAQPSALRLDFKDQYRSVVAAAYAANGNLPRAEARLALVGDANIIEALNAQAQRMLASTQAFERADLVVALASALEQETSGAGLSNVPVSTPTLEMIVNAGNTFTPSSPSSELTGLLSETPQVIPTQTLAAGTPTIPVEATSRSTHTSTPLPGKPFALTAEETVCDPNLPEALLQVLVLNANRRQLAGEEITVTWDGGKEQFFTGLKPELGNGYSDYVMNPDTLYSVQLARGSDVARGITPPRCQSPSGESFLGGIKLTFQQP